jgi:hypothetical protein
MDAIDYEKTGFIKGANARMKNSGYKVLLVSNPKTDEVDGKTRAWVAMEFDTHVRYLAIMDDLELI